VYLLVAVWLGDSWAVEVAFKKPRFFRFLKNLKKPKVQILGLGFFVSKIVFSISQSHIKSSEIRTQQFESYRV